MLDLLHGLNRLSIVIFFDCYVGCAWIRYPGFYSTVWRRWTVLVSRRLELHTISRANVCAASATPFRVVVRPGITRALVGHGDALVVRGSLPRSSYGSLSFVADCGGIDCWRSTLPFYDGESCRLVTDSSSYSYHDFVPRCARRHHIRHALCFLMRTRFSVVFFAFFFFLLPCALASLASASSPSPPTPPHPPPTAVPTEKHATTKRQDLPSVTIRREKWQTLVWPD